MEIETKKREFEVKDFNAETGEFTGYAAVFNNVDSAGESIKKGAFAKVLPSFVKNGWVGVNHDWMRLGAAYVVDAVEDDYGLLLKMKFHSIAEAQAVRTVVAERMAAGKSVRMSIGYRVLESEMLEGVRWLNDVDLYEASIVNLPANGGAIVVGVKSENNGLKFEEETVLLQNQIAKFTARVADMRDLKVKEGRSISAANMGKIQGAVSALRDAANTLEDLLTLVDESGKSDTKPQPVDVSKLEQTIKEY